MLIVFEGVDGCGKTTVVSHVLDRLENMISPAQVVFAKDPGGTELGDEIRKLLFQHPGTNKMTEGVADLLFLASHMELTNRVVAPALEAGKVVVADRYWPSQFAYAAVKNTPPEILQTYDQYRGPDPDLMIVLTGDVEMLMERALTRKDEHHKQMSKKWGKNVEGMKKVQKAFIDQFADRDWCKILDVGFDPPEVICSRADILIDGFLRRKGIIP